MAAPGNLRELRLKIRSIENLKKITRAMQMVSASKLKKTQARLLQIRPYADKIADLLSGLAANVGGEIRHPLFDRRPEVKAVAVVVMSADKGLCGTFNTNIVERARRFIRETGKPAKILAIGRKAADQFARQGAEVLARYVGLPTEVPFTTLQEMTRILLDEHAAGRVDEIHVAFTTYVNAMTFRPSLVRFVPVETRAAAGRPLAEYIFEPEPKAILARLIPRYLETSLHRMLLESMSSEHSARMNAMRNATDNATELIDGLTLVRNKVRQANITRELLDIVGGAEAIKA
jgi:F-type H+-transporting ATPase subunit gamma